MTIFWGMKMMSDTTYILSREDYELYKELHPEKIVTEEEWETHGVKFYGVTVTKSKPASEPNRATRRARKRKKP